MDIIPNLAGLTILDGRIAPVVRTAALRNVTAKLPPALIAVVRPGALLRLLRTQLAGL